MAGSQQQPTRIGSDGRSVGGGVLVPKRKNKRRLLICNNVTLLLVVSLTALVMTLGTFLAFHHHQVWWLTQHKTTTTTTTTSLNDLLLLAPLPQAPPPLHNVTSFEADHDHDDDALPKWLVEYMNWHAQQRRALTPDNYRSFRFLVLRCLEPQDERCGGLSDRIKPLPLLVLLAYQTNRIFLISWNRPCPLEAFLVPPPSTSSSSSILDWRTPDWLVPKLIESPLVSNANLILKKSAHKGTSILCVQMHDQHGGSTIYNKLVLQQQQSSSSGQGLAVEERAFRKVYGPLFRALFVPTPPLAAALAKEQDELWGSGGGSGGFVVTKQGANKGRYYAAAHLRAYYNPQLTESQIRALAVNAVQCAHQLMRPPHDDAPIYFASDSKKAIDHVRQYYSNSPSSSSNGLLLRRPIRVRTLHRGGREALHLDQAASRNCSDYYDVFLDIFHLANANCIAHGQGGFGRLGVLVSQNGSCLFAYISQSRIIECGANGHP